VDLGTTTLLQPQQPPQHNNVRLVLVYIQAQPGIYRHRLILVLWQHVTSNLSKAHVMRDTLAINVQQ